MEPINLVNFQIDLVASEVVTAMVAMVVNAMDTGNGTIGEKLTDSCVEIIMIVTGLTHDFIVKTTN